MSIAGCLLFISAGHLQVVDGAELARQVHSTVADAWCCATGQGISINFSEEIEYFPGQNPVYTTTLSGEDAFLSMATKQDFITQNSHEAMRNHSIAFNDGHSTKRLNVVEDRQGNPVQAGGQGMQAGGIQQEAFQRRTTRVTASSVVAALDPVMWVRQFGCINSRSFDARVAAGKLPTIFHTQEVVDGRLVLISQFRDPTVLRQGLPVEATRRLIIDPLTLLPSEGSIESNGVHYAFHLTWQCVLISEELSGYILAASDVELPGMVVPGVAMCYRYRADSPCIGVQARAALDFQFPTGTPVLDRTTGASYVIGDAAEVHGAAATP